VICGHLTTTSRSIKQIHNAITKLLGAVAFPTAPKNPSELAEVVSYCDGMVQPLDLKTLHGFVLTMIFKTMRTTQ